MRKSTGEYSKNWSDIAKGVKEEAHWCCVRCGHIHDPENGFTLTVHHLDLCPSNNKWWNLAALCQRCHLHIQGKVIMERGWMLDHSEWFKPYAAGYYASQNGLKNDQVYVDAHLSSLLALGQGQISLLDFKQIYYKEFERR